MHNDIHCWQLTWKRSLPPLTSIHPASMFLEVILRSPAPGGTTKNLIVSVAAEILRGVYPGLVEGLRMPMWSFRMGTNYSYFA
jgi:hypothetical protein